MDIKLKNTNLKTRWLLTILAASSAIVALVGCFPITTKVKANISSTEVTQKQNQLKIKQDVDALVALGARATGTPVMDKAIAYLQQEYQQAGYITKIQTFNYPQFRDRGSSLSIDGVTIKGKALNGSPTGNLTAPLIVVPNLGSREDFAEVDVKGAIAVVKRGKIRFLEKVQNAVAAGAVGLIIVNNQPDGFWGTLGESVAIPVLGLSGKDGELLLSAATPATLNVNTVQKIVTGRNLIAHKPGVTQPQLVIGGHYDSVANSPGANDNASGTAVVLDLARNLSNTPLGDRAWFVAFDGEEDGLHGSTAFVDRASPQFLNQLQGMLNFDMVGINNELKVAGDAALTVLVRQASPSVATFGAAVGSDHVPFALANVPTLFFTRGLDPNYHSPKDRAIETQLLTKTTEIGLDAIARILLRK